MFEVWTSQEFREPGENACENHAVNPDRMTIHGTKVGRDVVFNHDWLYMTLHSQHGCKIKLSINFKSDFKSSKKSANDEGVGAGNMSKIMNETLFGN